MKKGEGKTALSELSINITSLSAKCCRKNGIFKRIGREENKWNDSTSHCNESVNLIFTGAVIIPGAFTGMLAGGWLMKKLQLDMASSAKLLMCMSIIPAIGLVTLLFLGCQNIDLAGITSGYNSKEFVSTFHVNYKTNPKFLMALNASCNANCKCERETNYQPVCGENMITYYSPCHAGCTKLHIYTLADGTNVRVSF